jgi:hypothetical protein
VEVGGAGTYTHLRPRSLQFEQDGCLPALDTGRSLRSHLTLCACVSTEYGEEGGDKRDDRGKGRGMAIRSDGTDPKGRQGTLTSSFCKPRKRRTVRGSSSGWRLFGDGGRWRRRSPLRENRNYV